MPLSEPQKTIANSNARFKVVAAGRRFGKSHLALREMARVAREPGKKIFYVAPTYRQAKSVMWEKAKKRFLELKWVKKINESDLTITLVNDSTISLRGSDNHDSLRGVGLHWICCDEFAYMDQRAWTEVLRPTLSDTGGGAMFISTPAGKNNWAFDMFQRGQDPNETDWSSWQYTTAEGGQVPQSEIDAARRDLDERTYRQEYESSWESYSGTIYYGFKTENNVKPYKDEIGKEVLLFCDFNIDPISACVGVQCKDYIHIIDEIVIYGSNTDELVQETRNRYGDKRVVAYPDPAGAQRKTSAGGRTDISILQNAGFKVVHRNRHPAVKDRINAVNSALAPVEGDPKLLIDPKCRRLIESLSKQTYKEGTQIPNKDGWDHMNDALGYGIEYRMPVRRDYGEIEQPTHWGVQTR